MFAFLWQCLYLHLTSPVPWKMQSGQLLYSFYIVCLHSLNHLVGSHSTVFNMPYAENRTCLLSVFLCSNNTIKVLLRNKDSLCFVCWCVSYWGDCQVFFFFFSLESQKYSSIINHNYFDFMISSHLSNSSLVKRFWILTGGRKNNLSQMSGSNNLSNKDCHLLVKERNKTERCLPNKQVVGVIRTELFWWCSWLQCLKMWDLMRNPYFVLPLFHSPSHEIVVDTEGEEVYCFHGSF